ncbi:MAG: hypothetical protein EPN20_02390 [Magnetospirillum sp.]|nr:MAG: hypothetical protein EPN20_02390 [Magnetospirillum sp.]
MNKPAPKGKPTFRLRVTMPEVRSLSRDIEIPAGHSLAGLAKAIIGSVGWFFDHAYGFYDALGYHIHDSTVRYELFADMGDDGFRDDGPPAKSVKRTKVGQVFTAPGDKWQFVFDYGDDHRFIIEVLNFGEVETGVKYPRVVASKGKAPLQYPPEDDEDYDEED